MWPGILVQMLTTRQPTDDMIEVAIVSMEQALEADGEALPAGSGTLPREPLPPHGAGLKGRAGGRPRDGNRDGRPVTIDPPLPGV